MAIYEFKGKIEEVGMVQTFSSGFSKRDLIVDNGGKYPNPTKFTFKKDDCSKLDGLHKGEEVTVKFAVNGRRWDGPKGTQYFVDLVGLSVTTEAEHADMKNAVPPPATPSESDMGDMGDLDDMPF